MTRPSAIAVLLIVVAAAGCGRSDSSAGATDQNVAVPAGDPGFTALTDSWVIDNVNVMDRSALDACHAICQKLQDDGLAEMVVLIQNGVKHPEEYATHYGRWLKLGASGPSTEGGNNGLVWLIRPDAQEKMTYSVGRGLPKLTSSDLVDVMNSASEYFNFNNYDQGVLAIVQGTDRKIRAIYGRKGPKP